MDYEVEGFEASNLVKVRILIAGDEVDALSFLPQGPVREPRPQDPEAAAQGDPAPPVRGRAAGGDRRQDRRARIDRADAQGRDREVLRRRHHAQAQAAREAEGRQEAHAQVGSVEIPQKAFLSVLRTSEEE
jgi:GTP-binding protein LepA